MHNMVKTLLVVAAAAASATTHGSLVHFDNGTVKDTRTDLIWMYDWGVRTPADWWTQRAWAENLDFAGSEGWRLPTTAELMDVIGAAGGPDGLPTHFAQVQEWHYWTGSEGFTPAQAFTIRTDTLGRHSMPKDMPEFLAVAVRLPEPPTLALLLAALAAGLLTAAPRLIHVDRVASTGARADVGPPCGDDRLPRTAR